MTTTDSRANASEDSREARHADAQSEEQAGERRSGEEPPRSAPLSEDPGHPGGVGQAGSADPEPGVAESQGGGIEGAVGGGQSGQGGG